MGDPAFPDSVDGLLVEPLNPSFAISKNYYISDHVRKGLLGALNLKKEPNQEEVKMAKDIFKLYNDKLGLKQMEKLEEKFKALESKKKSNIQDILDRAKKMEEMLQKEDELRKKE